MYCTLATASPVARWKSTVHDFGAFDEDMGKVTTAFTLVNDGDEPLVIYAARASCGCTVPDYTSSPIAPGDSASVKVTYDPTGRPGKFSKRVKVETNSEPSQSVLTINGVVIGASHTLRSRFPVEAGNLKLRAKTVTFGDILKGRTKTEFLEGYNQSDDSIKPVVTGLPKQVTVSVKPEVVPPGEQVTFTFFYNTSKTADWGWTSDEVIIAESAESSRVQPVELIAIVNEDFSKLPANKIASAPKVALSTTSVDLGTIAPGSRHKAEITIDNYGKDPLLIRKVGSLDPAITVKAEKTEVKGGSQTKLKIEVDTEKCHDNLLNARIMLITNDPDRPVSNIRVVGEIK